MALKFSRLTRPAIRAMEPGTKLAEHGVIAEKQKNGDIRYTINVMVDGVRIHRVVGRDSEGVTREQAERLIESLRTKAREDRLDLPSARKLHRTFAEAATEYLNRMTETGGKDIANKRRHIEQRLSPYFGTQRLDQIKDFGVKQYCRKRRDAGAKQATVNRELATLSHMMNRAVEWKWIKQEQKPTIAKGDEPRKPITILSEPQSEALMKAAIADQDGRLWLFVMFGLNAAMRHSEIVRVRYDQIDFATRRIFIPQAKAGEREQPITKALADALANQRKMEDDPSGWVFPAKRVSKKGVGHRHSMEVQFARAVVRAGLDPDKVTPHVMRHTAITRLVRAGIDLPTIQKISGHKTLSMVLRYVHIHGEHIDTAIGALDRPFPNAITPELHMPAIPDQPEHGAVVAISSGKSKR